MTNEVNVQTVGERIEYIESLNARGVGTAVESQQFELACLHRLLASLTAQPVKLPKSERLDGNGYGYYFDMDDVFVALENAGIKFEVQE